MKSALALSTLSLLAAADAAETVLGAYIFHRHGDRTPKALAPTKLTTLGYEQVYRSGQYYNSRYITGDSKIKGISEDTVSLSQLSVTSPSTMSCRAPPWDSSRVCILPSRLCRRLPMALTSRRRSAGTS